MTPLRAVSRSMLVVLALAVALVACESPESDAAADETAESNPAVEATDEEQASAEQEAEGQFDEQAESNEEAEPEADEPKAGEQAQAEPPGGDGDESAKRKDIRKLLEITGSAKLGIQVGTQVLDQLKATAPDVPEEFWDEFKKDMSEQGLVDLIVPIYDKHMTHDEVKALITFFETPAGKSYVKKLPAITQESQIAGRQWGMEIAQKVQKRLQAKGYR